MDEISHLQGLAVYMSCSTCVMLPPSHFLRSNVLHRFYFILLYFIFAIFYWNRWIVGLEVTEELWLPPTSQYRGFASGWRVIRHSLRLAFYRNNRRGSF